MLLSRGGGGKDDYVRLGDDDNVDCVHTCRVDPFFATLSMRQRCAELMEIGFFYDLTTENCI